jgi:hypothetical protein
MAILCQEEQANDKTSGEPNAIIPRGQFSDPRYVRLSELDFTTLDVLMCHLLFLRRIKWALAGTACLIPFFLFRMPDWVQLSQQILTYGCLSATIGFGVGAVGSLVVRFIFLREAMQHGCSRGTAILAMMLAERRARTFIFSFKFRNQVDALIDAVLDVNRA